jgi:hypothetical protein
MPFAITEKAPPFLPKPLLSTMFNPPLDTHSPRLRLLQEHDKRRTWKSLEETRTCVLCGSDFAGARILISVRSGKASFGCPSPGCRGSLDHFVSSGNPLLEEDLWKEWMDCSSRAEGDRDEGWEEEPEPLPHTKSASGVL